ncbi:MAG: cobalt-precorrin-5B (C(1))-methyltransferase [Alphaproteobacteria bacterium]|nr:cobalt-precorrin-5B (C(1))-methyltransferase [Alphaproteobacteria bacterium]
MDDLEKKKLKSGYTTGACATACASGALLAWLQQKSLSQTRIILPKGQQVTFALHDVSFDENSASAATIKDAGDDPDITHGATIRATVNIIKTADNNALDVIFKAGEGVGIVTKAGLPIKVGEPAINPVPRQMIEQHLQSLAVEYQLQAKIIVTISVDNGASLAEKTWNPRLGIEGGLSILGTSGIVRPYSCAAWIHAIHRGIDVARALGLNHVAGSTGNLSEALVERHYQLSQHALIDMGDFAAGMLKYLKKHPIKRVTICGGFGKMLKLALGHGDLHSARSQIDFTKLQDWARDECDDTALADLIATANSANHLSELLQTISSERRLCFLRLVAQKAINTASGFAGDNITIDVILINRQGELIYSSV